LIEQGFRFKARHGSMYRETKDFDQISSDDPFVGNTTEKVQIFRDSEHYFAVGIQLKNGNWLHVSAPIKSRYVECDERAKGGKKSAQRRKQRSHHLLQMENRNMHAFDAQKRIMDIMSEIDDTSPLPPKNGRMLVALNVLANEICTDNDHEDYVEMDVDKWLNLALEDLPACVTNFDLSKDVEAIDNK